MSVIHQATKLAYSVMVLPKATLSIVGFAHVIREVTLPQLRSGAHESLPVLLAKDSLLSTHMFRSN